MSGVLLLLATACRVGQADTVELPLDSGATATAWFQPGDRDVAVLVLHGFLQTRNYLTVSALRGSLAEQGYTILAPTLSLGVDRRKASLPCEAAHVHTLADDLSEIARWVDWLEARGHRNIVLAGHSYGALQVLAYAAAEPAESVRMVIGVSLIGAEDQVDLALHRSQVARAAERVARGDIALDDYRLSYCNRFVASPSSFASYGRWDSEQVLEGLSGVSRETRVILGGGDIRLPRNWAQRLRSRGAKVSVIDGAGHFFDDRYEFDLLDEVLEALAEMPEERS